MGKLLPGVNQLHSLGNRQRLNLSAEQKTAAFVTTCDLFVTFISKAIEIYYIETHGCIILVTPGPNSVPSYMCRQRVFRIGFQSVFRNVNSIEGVLF